MCRTLNSLAFVLFFVASTAIGVAAIDDSKETKPVPAVLNFTLNSLDGKPVDLSKYAGKVVLIVNTASQCGYTPQYKQLQALHEKYADKGLAILGFPANDFGQQEPGTNEEIATFCAKNFGVEFDMFAKVVVTGDKKCALYEFLTSEKTDPKHAGEVKWNFEKFLIGRNGEIVNRFRSKVEPASDELTKAIEEELAKNADPKKLSAASSTTGPTIHHDLDHLIGTWQHDPEFDAAIEKMRRIDPEEWV